MYDRPYQSWRSPSIARNRSACDQLVWSPWSPERMRACFTRFVCKGISLFLLVPLAPNLAPDWSFAEQLKKEAGSERTVGPVQTFFFRAEDRPWSQGHMGALAAPDSGRGQPCHQHRRASAGRRRPHRALRQGRRPRKRHRRHGLRPWRPYSSANRLGEASGAVRRRRTRQQGTVELADPDRLEAPVGGQRRALTRRAHQGAAFGGHAWLCLAYEASIRRAM